MCKSGYKFVDNQKNKWEKSEYFSPVFLLVNPIKTPGYAGGIREL